MLRRPAPRRLLTWLTLWALGLGVLAPTLAQTVVRTGEPASWVQVCSSTGMFWVRAGDAPEAPWSDGQMACPWCALPGGADAPPSAVFPFWPSVSVASVLAVPLRPLDGALAWAQPPVRAPPLRA